MYLTVTYALYSLLLIILLYMNEPGMGWVELGLHVALLEDGFAHVLVERRRDVEQATLDEFTHALHPRLLALQRASLQW